MCVFVSLRLVDLNDYLDAVIGLWLAKIDAVVLNKATHDTLYSLKKVKIYSKKRLYGNYGFSFACDLKKCPG